MSLEVLQNVMALRNKFNTFGKYTKNCLDLPRRREGGYLVQVLSGRVFEQVGEEGIADLGE